jgi:3-oxoacyl-[acyl-carrier-protein] synthase II
MGAVTGYGWGRKLFTEGLMSGKSAVRWSPGFGPYFENDHIWAAPVEEGGDSKDGRTRFARATRFAAREAVHDALDRGWRPGPVVGLVHGVILGDVDFQIDKNRRFSARDFLDLMPSTLLSQVMAEFDFHGPTMSVMAMCASGVVGLLTAKMWVDSGMVSDVLLLTTDLSGSGKTAYAFYKLGVVVVDQPSLEACRPFQEGSRGFCPGEAATGMMVSARQDGAYGRVLGGSMSNDGHHVSSIDPNHAHIKKCWQVALDNAGVQADEVAYLSAHGPGTKQCDTAEATIFDDMFPSAAGLYSIKPLSGHCLGSAAGVELMAAFDSLERGVIAAPLQVAPGHPKLLDGPTKRRDGLIIKSSLGLGGYNAATVLAAAR